MGKGFGIAAFVLLLISLPIPIVGNYVSLLAVLLLSVAAYNGEKVWTITVDLIAWVKMFLLSPTWHLMMFGGGHMRSMSREMEAWGSVDPGSRAMMEGSTRGMDSLNGPAFLITVLILVAPIAILIWRSRTAADAASPSDG